MFQGKKYIIQTNDTKTYVIGMNDLGILLSFTLKQNVNLRPPVIVFTKFPSLTSLTTQSVNYLGGYL